MKVDIRFKCRKEREKKSNLELCFVMVSELDEKYNVYVYNVFLLVVSVCLSFVLSRV